MLLKESSGNLGVEGSTLLGESFSLIPRRSSLISSINTLGQLQGALAAGWIIPRGPCCLPAPPLPQFSTHTIEFSSYLTRRQQNQKNKCLVKTSFPYKDFASLSLQGFFFPPHVPAAVRTRAKSHSQCLGCLCAYPLWDWMKPPLPQAFLICLLQVVNIDCWSRAIYLRMHLVNIYVACSWLSVPEQRGE